VKARRHRNGWECGRPSGAGFSILERYQLELPWLDALVFPGHASPRRSDRVDDDENDVPLISHGDNTFEPEGQLTDVFAGIACPMIGPMAWLRTTPRGR
jgi:hypothetical protein